MARHSLLFGLLLATAILALYIISSNRGNIASDISKMLSWNFKNEETSSLSYAEKRFKLYDGVETFVMFIGYPRSSHSLVGAILDAHPEIIIPHQYDVIKHWGKYQKSRVKEKRMQKYLLFFDLHQLSMKQAMFEIRASRSNSLLNESKYLYQIPGLWQGGYEQRIKVIGDKKGGDTALALSNHSSLHIFEEIRQVVQVPIKFVHVIRNPFDNIATMMLRATGLRDAVRDENEKVRGKIWVVYHLLGKTGWPKVVVNGTRQIPSGNLHWDALVPFARVFPGR